MLTLVRMATTLALALLELSAMPQGGHAQTYPVKSITVVVHFQLAAQVMSWHAS
jgi:hypothetical protein